MLEDARTGARQPFSDVIAIATDRAFGDTARFARITTDVSVPQLIALAHERPGTYEVTVHAAGYLTATVRDVAVQQERACRHVITRGLIVRLEPR